MPKNTLKTVFVSAMSRICATSGDTDRRDDVASDPQTFLEPALPDAHAAYDIWGAVARGQTRSGFLDLQNNSLDRTAMPFLVRALPAPHEIVSYPTVSAFVTALQEHTASDRPVFFNAIVPMSDKPSSSTVHTVAMSVRRDEARAGARLSLIYVEPSSLPDDEVAEVQSVSELTPMHRMGLILASIYHDFFGTILPAAFAPESAPHRRVISTNLQKSRQDCAMFSLFLARKMTREQTDSWHRANVRDGASLAPWPGVTQDEALHLPPAFYKHASSVSQIGRVVERSVGNDFVNKRGESLMARTDRHLMPRSDQPTKYHNGSILLKRQNYVRRALETLPGRPQP